MAKLEKINGIEFLRIVGILSIVIYHLFSIYGGLGNVAFSEIPLYQKLGVITHNGNKAVELFFIISGVLFGYKLNLNLSLVDFIKKKVLNFWPLFLFVIFLYFVASLFGFVEFYFYENILDLFGLSATNLVITRGNVNQFWYISAMLWATGIYFFLLKSFNKNVSDFLIFCTVLFSYSLLVQIDGGQISSTYTFLTVFRLGFVRGLAGIGLGYFIGKWYRENSIVIRNLTINLKTKIFITILEFCCLFFIINNLMLHVLKFNNHIIFVLVFALVILLLLLNKGFISEFINSINWNFLSKYTYSLFMIHLFVKEILIFYIKNNNQYFIHTQKHPITIIVLYTVITLIITFFIYHCIEKNIKERYGKYY